MRRRPTISRLLLILGTTLFRASAWTSLVGLRVRLTMRTKVYRPATSLYKKVRFKLWEAAWWLKGWLYQEVRELRYGALQMRIATKMSDWSQALYTRGHENFVGHPERLKDLQHQILDLQEDNDDISWELSYIRGKLHDFGSDIDFLTEKVAFLEENNRSLHDREHREVQRALNYDDAPPIARPEDPNWIDVYDNNDELLELS